MKLIAIKKFINVNIQKNKYKIFKNVQKKKFYKSKSNFLKETLIIL